VQNLNENQTLPLADASVDAALIVAGWQYLQQPEAVAAELLRILRPGGQLIVAFSKLTVTVSHTGSHPVSALDPPRPRVLLRQGQQHRPGR
jgi:ubiquinone/menaquinone biosynthesis C-methylase UbiE